MKRENKISEQLDREKKIRSEFNRIKKIYKDMDKEKVKVLEGLLHDAAFMKISLESIRDDLVKNGFTENFENGSQRFERERPNVKIYTTLVQRYSNVMKQLIDLMPEDVKEDEKDGFFEFIQGAKGVIVKK